MIQTINKARFHNAFYDAGRGKQFTCDALDALYYHYTAWEEREGEQMELDTLAVVAICCEWRECTRDELIETFAHKRDDYEYFVRVVEAMEGGSLAIRCKDTWLVRKSVIGA